MQCNTCVRARACLHRAARREADRRPLLARLPLHHLPPQLPGVSLLGRWLFGDTVFGTREQSAHLLKLLVVLVLAEIARVVQRRRAAAQVKPVAAKQETRGGHTFDSRRRTSWCRTLARQRKRLGGAGTGGESADKPSGGQGSRRGESWVRTRPTHPTSRGCPGCGTTSRCGCGR